MSQQPLRVYSYAQCVGAVLRYFRETRGLTQQVVADRMGSAQASVALIESGKRAPSLDWLFRWSARGMKGASLGHVFTLADLVRFNMGRGTHCLDNGWGTGDRETVRCTVDELIEVARRLNDDTIIP